MAPVIARRYGRTPINCEAVLLFPGRNAHPRIKAHLFQIGQGGCALWTSEKLFIGEECRVWAMIGGRKCLEVSGRIVWMKTTYEDGAQRNRVGIEFRSPIELAADLLERMKNASV